MRRRGEESSEEEGRGEEKRVVGRRGVEMLRGEESSEEEKGGEERSDEDSSREERGGADTTLSRVERVGEKLGECEEIR